LKSCTFILLLVVACLSAAGHAQEDDTVSAGFIYDRFELTLEPGMRTEAAGPFWTEEERWQTTPAPAGEPAPATAAPVTDIARTFTLAPFFTRTTEPLVENVGWSFAYPVVTYHRHGKEYRVQIGQLLAFSGGNNQANNEAHMTTIFPIVWLRRSPDESLNYTAVWPFYGRFESHMFRDEAKFILWPFYVQTRKRDVITDNYMFPFVHVRHGDHLAGWQAWPFYGTEHKDTFSRTNRFGDLETVAGHDSQFILWPFYSREDSGIGSTNQTAARSYLPFYTSLHSPTLDRRTYFWPFGLTLLKDEVADYHQTSLLFPVFEVASGKGKDAFRIFPLYGTANYPGRRSSFALWPLYRHRDLEGDLMERHETRIAFFLLSDIETKNKTTGKSAHRTDFAPLFIARRDFEGNERFQIFAPLEPFLPENKHIQRLYSPLWSLWRSEKNAKTGASSQSLLWNLYRSEQTPKTRKCSLLFGLIQYHSTPEGKRWRFFYLPSGKAKARPPGKS
jgi:hypothetical protein